MATDLKQYEGDSLQKISLRISEGIVSRLAGMGYQATEDGSNLSISRYVQVGDLVIRISDHDAKPWNTHGAFRIALAPGIFHDHHCVIETRPVFREERLTPIAWEDGEPVDFELIDALTLEDRDEHGQKFERVGQMVDEDHIEAAIDAAVSFVASKEQAAA